MKLCITTFNTWSRIFQILSVLIIISSCALALTYTKDAVSVTSKWCINDCIDGECLVDIDTIEKCNPTDRPVPTFFTTGQKHTNYYKCKSRCKVLRGDNLPRCYVDYGWTKLDYCNPRYTKFFELRDFTKDDGPCHSHCTTEPNNMKTIGQCLNSHNEFSVCYVDKYLYETVFTINDKECNGECLRHGGTSYSWCYQDGFSWFGWDYCARPALFEKTCEECLSIKYTNMGNETVTAYAERIERDSRFKTVSVDDPHSNNPVHKYTYDEIKLKDGNVVKLPLVVRAVIKSAHIKPKNLIGTWLLSNEDKTNCDRMGMAETDVAGLLIGNKLGGPKDFYNVVPMTPAVHIGRTEGLTVYDPSKWLVSQSKIAHFFEHYNGQVHLTIVLSYNLDDPDYPYRPVRIGWGRWDYVSNGNPIFICPNNWLNNTYNSDDPDCYN